MEPVYETGLPDDYITTFVINTVHDYYPYGKVLREYIHTADERYLSTQHERDAHTGLDYRGARYYDSDIARFLSTDPWQAKYPGWSTYNYVMGNPISLIDPTGKGPEDWVKTEKGEYVWDNTVTNPLQVHSGQTYIGKDNSDIVKDLFGQTSFTESTWDVGTTGMDSGNGWVASNKAKVNTTLSVSIQANIIYEGDKRTFNGIDFYASATGSTSAPLPPDKKMDFEATSVKFNEYSMESVPEYNGATIKPMVGTGSFICKNPIGNFTQFDFNLFCLSKYRLKSIFDKLERKKYTK